MAIRFPGTMREFVSKYIKPSMSDDEFKLALGQFCDEKTSLGWYREIYKRIYEAMKTYNRVTNGKLQKECWNEYIWIRDLNFAIHREAAEDLKCMLIEGEKYKLKVSSNYYKEMDRDVWDRPQIEWYNFEEMAEYETEKAIGKANLRILEDWQEFRRDSGPKNRG